MKLWIKVSLVAVIMVAAAVSICNLFLLVGAGRSNLNYAINSTVSAQKTNAAYWMNAMAEEIKAETGAATARSLARYFVAQLADENIVLNAGTDSIYNATCIEPADYLPLAEGKRQYIIADVAGKSMLMVGSQIAIQGTIYSLYMMQDVTSIYADITEMAYRFSWISFAIMFIAGLVELLLVRKLLKPIKTLKENTSLIAAGVYDRRIRIAEQDEIGELAEDFNSMADAVERRVEELKEEAARRTLFMSALTHELKTPMTSIKGNAQTLLVTRMEEEEREQALMQIDADCTRVEKLSQKLMHLIVLKQSGEIALKEQKTSKLFAMVEAACQTQLKNRGLSLTIRNQMDTLSMDLDLLCALLLNLIDNAGKASAPGQTIEILAASNVISVMDWGGGIPESALPQLTQPFYRVDKARSRKQGGIGLGLALAEEIARLHRARLAFESEVGKGTTVKVVFENEA